MSTLILSEPIAANLIRAVAVTANIINQVPSDWLLADGAWEDNNFWRDEAFWRD